MSTSLTKAVRAALAGQDPVSTVVAWCANARTALVQAVSVEEAKSVLSAISTLEHALKVRDMNQEAVVAASTMRIRAERRVGELLREQTTRGERRPRGNVDDDDIRPTLAEQGLTRDESSTYQRLAAASPARFEQAVERVTKDALEQRHAVTRREVLRAIDPQSVRTPFDAFKDGDRFKTACDRVTALADAAMAAIQWGHFPGPSEDLMLPAVRHALREAREAITRVEALLRKRGGER